MGIQYLSQLGAKAESPAVTEAIRKGVTNLLQSRCLFRLGDPEDAREADAGRDVGVPDDDLARTSNRRELMGATPEQSFYLPVHYCLASWIAGGARVARFFGETYAFKKLRAARGPNTTCGVLEETVGAYPEQMPKTYKRLGQLRRREPAPSAAATGERPPDGRRRHASAAGRPDERARSTGRRRATPSG